MLKYEKIYWMVRVCELLESIQTIGRSSLRMWEFIITSLAQHGRDGPPKVMTLAYDAEKILSNSFQVSI